MSDTKPPFSRRDFLKLAGLGAGALALPNWTSRLSTHGTAAVRLLPEFPAADLIGRNTSGGKIQIRARPNASADIVKEVYEDALFPWVREVTAEWVDYNRYNQRWVETPEGYVYGPWVQPTRNQPNTPMTAIPAGQEGFWAEVTVPYVDLTLDNPPARSPGVQVLIGYGQIPRLYYSQVVWIDQIMKTDSGAILYRFNESNQGGYGDIFWADGAAFRPLTEEDVSPIHPDVDPATKVVLVNTNYQTLSCYEEGREVYFCRVSTGAAEGSTPLSGDGFAVWRKIISVHMSGGNLESGYDGPAVSWATFFVGDGVAIHAATWHNDFGFARSHGCVNCKPEDAKWIYRWTLPVVPLVPGDLTWSDWTKGSTRVRVIDTL